MDGDDKIIKAGINGIKKLNAKYENKFFISIVFVNGMKKRKSGWDGKGKEAS